MAETVAAFAIAGVLLIGSVVIAIAGRKMRRRELRPNSFAGVRTRGACRSREDWYAIQSACAPFVLLLAFFSLDSAILFIIQGVLHEAIPILVPSIIMAVQLAVGIVLVHRAASAEQ